MLFLQSELRGMTLLPHKARMPHASLRVDVVDLNSEVVHLEDFRFISSISGVLLVTWDLHTLDMDLKQVA